MLQLGDELLVIAAACRGDDKVPQFLPLLSRAVAIDELNLLLDLLAANHLNGLSQVLIQAAFGARTKLSEDVDHVAATQAVQRLNTLRISEELAHYIRHRPGSAHQPHC
eukprot:2682917-Lingulodinium_polyedra.AAC.1